MTPTVIALSLAAIAILFVAAPFLRGRGRAAHDGRSTPPRSGRGAGPVESALPDQLEELDLDHAMGKLSDADYERARRAIEAARAKVAPAPVDVPSTAASAATATSLRERAEAMIREARAESVACPQCGERPEPAARYCSRCGSAIPA